MATMVKLQTVTVGSGGAASIDFTNIPQTYTDLKIVLSVRNTTSANRTSLLLSLNSSTTSFTGRALYGEDGTAGSETPIPARRLGAIASANATASAFSVASIYIPNYTSSTRNKFASSDVFFEQNSSTVYDLYATSTLWSVNDAITSITLSTTADNFAQYSTATLYGIKSS